MSVGGYVLDPGVRIFVHDLGLAWSRITRRAGLPGDLLRAGPVTLSEDRYFALWRAIEAESGVGEPAVAVADAVSAEAFSPPLIAALSSATLAEAAHRIAHYKPLIGPMTLELDEPPGELQIACRWPGAEPPGLLALAELVFWVALARLGTRTEVRPVSVVLPRVLPGRAAVEDYLGCRVRRGERYAVTFRRLDATRPFLTANTAMWELISPELGRRLDEVQGSVSIAQRVRAALLETLPAGDASIGAVARALAVSVRTLQRQLTAEQTSFQAVLSGTRSDLAQRYLATTELPASDIAYLLGYDDSSSFYRAFHIWTGQSPGAARGSAP